MAAMGTKIGTKAFSNPNNTPITKAETTRTSAAGADETLGSDNVGEMANKLSDAAWVDPSKKMRATGNANMDKDAFFKLMLTQMKHQDPTNPLKSHEMAAQLAQFTSLEQLQNMNSTLQDMRAGQKPAESFQALSFIGKAVAGDSAKLIRGDEKSTHDFTFTLPTDVAGAEVKVRNPSGEIVRTFKMTALKAGENKINWDGKSEQGVTQGTGEYQFLVEAKDANGKKVAVKTDFQGTISGVNYTAEGPVLLIGDKTIRMADVKKIVDPGIKNNDQKLNPVNENTKQDLKKGLTVEETKKNAAVTVEPGKGNLATGVAMTGGMKNKLETEATN